MTPGVTALRPTVVDTSVLLNYLGPGRFNLPSGLRRLILITAEVNLEIKRDRAVLDGALASGRAQVENRLLGEDAELFARLTRRLSIADASCIVTARALRADLATDDRVLRNAATEVLAEDRLLGTESLLAEAIQAGLLTLEEGDLLLGELVTFKYRPKIASFREIIP